MTGAAKNYANPQGTAFQPVQDTSAFATCAPSALAEATVSAVAAASPLLSTAISDSTQVSETCVADSTTLCLNNSRYKVQTRWLTRDGASGSGQVIPLTGDTGAF